MSLAVPRRAGLMLAAAWLFAAPTARAEAPPRPDDALRVALFNVSLARGEAGALIDELRAGGGPQIEAVVEILQRVDADVVVLLELDWDRAGEALRLFEAELAIGRNGAAGVAYAHRFQAPVNAGDPSLIDLDNDGKDYGPGDAFGWGVFPGQFGVAILSRHPIDRQNARTFRLLRWADTPFAALRPRLASGEWFHSAAAWDVMRLSSKTHLDAPVTLPGGATLHLLVSHPTPPVFDGPEDRNGARNAAEILFWRDYVAPQASVDWIRDDQGRRGGLTSGASFVIAGDLNADPLDGEGRHEAIGALLSTPALQDPAPTSTGGVSASAAQEGVNVAHQGDPARDTADWRDDEEASPGNLRVDYLLPSADLEVIGAGVFWPSPDSPLARLVGDGFPAVSSDHRLVWIDLRLPSR